MFKIKRYLKKETSLFTIILLILVLLLNPMMVYATEDPGGQEIGTGGDVDWWPMFQHDMTRSGLTTTSTAPDTNNVVWTFDTESAIGGSPAIVEQKVYIVTSDGMVHCLNANTGLEIWSTSIESVYQSSPEYYNGRLYISSYEGYRIYCLDAEDGSILWSNITNGWILSSPLLYNNCVYTGTYSGGVYCFNAENGDLNWLQIKGPIWSSPAIYEGNLYLASSNRNVYCLYPNNGTEIWSQSIADGVISSTPMISAGRLYVGSNDFNLYCLNALTGGNEWRFSTIGQIHSSPAAFDNKVYFGGGSRIYCVNATTGQQIWMVPTSGIVRSSPAIADDKVYVPSTNDILYCLDVENGDILWTYSNLGGISHNSPAIAGGKLYQPASNGLYCFRDNTPPSIPAQPSGISIGEAGSEYTFSTSAVDIDEDAIFYLWDWGDNSFSDWLGPYDSGESIQAQHTWSRSGTYAVKVKVKDTSEAESPWSASLPVEITSPFPALDIHAPSSVLEGLPFSISVTSTEIPVQNVTIEFNNEIFHTDLQGIVLLTAPLVDESTDYLLSAKKTGYQSDTTWITVLNKEEEQTETAWIYGVVTSTEGNTLEGVSICILIGGTDMKMCMFTKDQGEYYVAIPPGTHTLQARILGYQFLEESFTIGENAAFEKNLILSKQPQDSPETTTSSDTAIDRLINTLIQEENIGATVIVTDDYSSVEIFRSGLTINFADVTTENIIFRISSETLTREIIAVRIDANSLTDPTQFKLSFDEEEITHLEAGFNEVFTPESTEDAVQWTSILTYNNQNEPATLFFFINAPLSEHTITISSVVETITGTTLILLYLAIMVIAGLIFLGYALSGPVIRFILKKKK